MKYLGAVLCVVFALVIAVGVVGPHGPVFATFLMLLLLPLIPAVIASKKGRDFLVWWNYGVLLFVVALVHALLISKDEKQLEDRAMSDGDLKKCPYCAELVKAQAVKCKHCGSDLGGDVVASREHEPQSETGQKVDVIPAPFGTVPTYREDR